MLHIFSHVKQNEKSGVDSMHTLVYRSCLQTTWAAMDRIVAREYTHPDLAEFLKQLPRICRKERFSPNQVSNSTWQFFRMNFSRELRARPTKPQSQKHAITDTRSFLCPDKCLLISLNIIIIHIRWHKIRCYRPMQSKIVHPATTNVH